MRVKKRRGSISLPNILKVKELTAFNEENND